MTLEAKAPENVLELERKYEATNSTSLPSLAGIAGVTSVSAPEVCNLDATYYDTSDLRLLRAGITLRRRTGGADAGWHLKLPVGQDARTELRLPLDVAAAPPDEFTTLLTARLRGTELVAVANLVTTREQQILTGKSGGLLAEIVVDKVRATDFDRPEPIEWQEVEVEWQESGRKIADAVERLLSSVGIERAEGSTKLGRALEKRLKALGNKPVTVTRHSRAHELLNAYLRGQVDAIVDSDLDFRRDLPDAVHQIRVASRRARSALAAFAPGCGIPDVSSITEELRWLGIELGAARDVEVQRQRADARLVVVVPAFVVGPVQARIATHFTAQADQARSRALDALSSARYLTMLDALEGIAEKLQDPAFPEPAKSVVPRVLDRMTAAVDKRVDKIAKAPVGDERDAAAHKARKAAKRLRYAIEVVRPLAPKPTERALLSFEHLQDVMGEHQDSIVARQQLLELAREAELAQESGFTYGALSQIELEIGAAQLRRLPAAWRKTRRAGHKLRRRV
jgi:CHAD domain-containing protein